MMRLFLTTVRTAILYILRSKIEKGDPKHKKGTQFPKKVPNGDPGPQKATHFVTVGHRSLGVLYECSSTVAVSYSVSE